MPRKKRVFYPPPKTSARPAPTIGPDARSVNDRSVSIDLSALAGRGQLKPGDKVTLVFSERTAFEVVPIN